MRGPVYGRTCEGCEHVIAEAWAKGKTAHRCNAPGPCRGYVVGQAYFLPYIPAWCPKLVEGGRQGGKAALLKKIRALAERGVGGEADNAEEILRRLMEKYGVSEDELDEEERRRHDFEYHGKEQEKLLRQVVYKVTGGYAYNLVYRASGRKVKTRLGADCTAAEKVEIEFLFDFYTRLWERERDAFLSAFIQKHRIFTIRDDIEPQEVSREELLKMQALMLGMSDESPVRALPAQQ